MAQGLSVHQLQQMQAVSDLKQQEEVLGLHLQAQALQQALLAVQDLEKQRLQPSPQQS